MLDEFKQFIMRGNVLDLAVGIVVGAAFGAVVTSSLFIALDGESYPSLAAAKAAGAPTLNYGLFINTIISLLIVGFAVFLVVRQVNRFLPKPAPAPAPPATKDCPFCVSVIPLRATRCPHCTSELRTA